MKTLTHETAARVVQVEVLPREPYQRQSMLSSVTLMLMSGGETTIHLPNNFDLDKFHCFGGKAKVTVEFTVPERVDTLETILKTQGTIAALDYARKELAK